MTNRERVEAVAASECEVLRREQAALRVAEQEHGGVRLWDEHVAKPRIEVDLLLLESQN